jgi:hypothetical protein
MKVLGFALCLVGCVSTYANPVVAPSFVMTAENVLVGVSTEGIYVAGTYRFHTLPYPDHLDLEKFPVLGWLDIPIPVPDSEKIDSELMAELKPELTIGYAKFFPGKGNEKFSDLPRVNGVKFMCVSFYLGHISAPDIEMVIKYSQPVIRRDGRLWAYYMPLLENYKSHEMELGLKHSSYVISFEAVQGVSLSFRKRDEMTVIQSGPKLASFEAHNEQIIEVEIVPNQSPGPSSASVTPTGGQLARHP